MKQLELELFTGHDDPFSFSPEDRRFLVDNPNPDVLDLVDEAMNILTNWLIDRSSDDPEDGQGFEDIDPDIDNARELLFQITDMLRDPQDEDDGQPDEMQENQDFAQDGDFENMEASEIL